MGVTPVCYKLLGMKPLVYSTAPYGNRTEYVDMHELSESDEQQAEKIDRDLARCTR